MAAGKVRAINNHSSSFVNLGYATPWKLELGGVDLIVNTTEGRQAISDSSTIRSSAEQHRVYYTTTMAGGSAVCEALGFSRSVDGGIKVRSLQSLHKGII